MNKKHVETQILVFCVIIIQIIFFISVFMQNNSIINKLNKLDKIEKTQIYIKECLYTIYPVSEIEPPIRIESLKKKIINDIPYKLKKVKKG